MKEERIEIIKDDEVCLEIDVEYFRTILDKFKELELNKQESFVVRRVVDGVIKEEMPVARQDVKVNEEWVRELVSSCTKHIEFYNKYLRGISYLRIMDDFIFFSKHLQENHKVLEVGALPPLLDLILNEKCGISDITVLDPNASEFKEFFDRRKINYIEANIIDIENCIGVGEYDVIIISAVWEHLLVDIYQLIKVIHSRLKKEGLLLFTVHTTSSISGIYGLLCADSGFATKYNEGIVEQYKRFEENGYYGHIREYTTKEIEELFCHKSRFKIIDRKFDRMYTGSLVDTLEAIYTNRAAMAKYVFKKRSYCRAEGKEVCLWGRGHVYQMNNNEIRKYFDIRYVIDSKVNEEVWLGNGTVYVAPEKLDEIKNPYVIVMLEREEYREQVSKYLDERGILYDFYDQLELEDFVPKRPEV